MMSTQEKAEIEARVKEDALGGLSNIYHAITGNSCEKYVALGMATAAVSSLRVDRDELLKAAKGMIRAFNLPEDGSEDIGLENYFRKPVIELRAAIKNR